MCLVVQVSRSSANDQSQPTGWVMKCVSKSEQTWYKTVLNMILQTHCCISDKG